MARMMNMRSLVKYRAVWLPIPDSACHLQQNVCFREVSPGDAGGVPSTQHARSSSGGKPASAGSSQWSASSCRGFGIRLRQRVIGVTFRIYRRFASLADEDCVLRE